MKTWEEVVDDRRWRYIDMLRKAEELTLAQSAIDELHMVLENCVPVVRCKDCIMTRGKDEHIGRWWCIVHQGYMTDNYYCADGKRR